MLPSIIPLDYVEINNNGYSCLDMFEALRSAILYSTIVDENLAFFIKNYYRFTNDFVYKNLLFIINHIIHQIIYVL